MVDIQVIQEIENSFPDYIEVEGKKLVRGDLVVSAHYYCDDFFDRDYLQGLYQHLSMPLKRINDEVHLAHEYHIACLSAAYHARRDRDLPRPKEEITK